MQANRKQNVFRLIKYNLLGEDKKKIKLKSNKTTTKDWVQKKELNIHNMSNQSSNSNREKYSYLVPICHKYMIFTPDDDNQSEEKKIIIQHNMTQRNSDITIKK